MAETAARLTGGSQSSSPSPRLAVVIPFHRRIAHLQRALTAVDAAELPLEVVVAADGAMATNDLREHVCHRVVHLSPTQGPAIARNRAVMETTAAYLAFVDADVVVEPGALQRMVDALDAEPELAGIFGAYDLRPAEANFVSQFRNLSHAFVHEAGRPDACTFWAGLGAIRRETFLAVGGFDERFGRPSIEDIDLGYRLSAAGYRLRLDPGIRGTHLKRWTMRSSVVSDVRDRGVPWTQALLKYGASANDLNVSWKGRASVVLALCMAASVCAIRVDARAGWAAALAGATFLAINARYLARFVEVRGFVFAIGVVPLLLLHHLCNAVSAVVGSLLWCAQGCLGLRTAWTLPPEAWLPGSLSHHTWADRKKLTRC